jgi:GntR family transcriptional regulator
LAEYHNIRLVRGHKTLEATLANDDEAHHLGIKKGAAVLLSESVLYTEDDRPRVFIKVAYRGDRYTYYVRMAG